MRRRTQRRLILMAQLLSSVGLAVVTLWNLASLLAGFPSPGWLGLFLPAPGLLLWGAAVAGPAARAKASIQPGQPHRLVYDAAASWNDGAVRKALLNLIRTSGSLEITWAREGEGSGCWLAVAAGYEAVLQRLVRDVFPEGDVEPDRPPQPGQGVVVLSWPKAPAGLPGPAELCQIDGIEGVFWRWRNSTSATVALWGPQAAAVAGTLAGPADLLPGHGDALCFPQFVGDNPWPELPPFPPSRHNPGLAAVSNMTRLAPELQLKGGPALVLGRDAEQHPVGFTLPDLQKMRLLQVYGAASETAAVTLADQAVRAGVAIFFLDGHGLATTLLTRRLMRAVAAGQVLVCDVERPAQSRFRFNPLWLPEAWPDIFPAIWLEWLRELGVTPAGLGQNAYRHTLIAAVLAALLAAKRHLSLDPAGLRDVLQLPDALTMVEDDLSPILGEALWRWWLAQGRKTPSFDVHLRLGNLRDRLTALLEIPEYGVLWQAPYLDPLIVRDQGLSLIWRLPDPRRRLQPYISSQLLGITALLSVWPANRPVVIVLHELEARGWVKRLSQFPMARIIVVSPQVKTPPIRGKTSSLLISRLSREDAERIGPILKLRPADLRRLPPQRLLLQHDQSLGTFEMGD